MPKARRKTGERSRVSPDPGLSSSDISDNTCHPFSAVGLDIVLNYDVPAREFLLPHLSFKDLFSLERTSRALRDVIREKQLWRCLVEKFRRQDEAVDRLLACYSTSRSVSHPDYFRKMALKYLSDTSKIDDNIQDQSFKMHCMRFSRATTSRDAFTFHESGQTAMILNGDSCDVLTVRTNKSKRGMEVNLLRSFPSGIEQNGAWPSSGIALLASSGDLLFHVQYLGCRVWNWRDGSAWQIAEPSPQKMLLGLGFPTVLKAQAEFLIIGSSSGSPLFPNRGSNREDRDFPGQEGEASIHIWEVSLDDAERRVHLSPIVQIARHPDEDASMKFTEADSDKNIVVASGPVSKRIYIYDLKTKILGRVNLGAFVRAICVNASLMRAVVALAPDFESRPDVNDHAVIVDIRTGKTLRRIRDDEFAPPFKNPFAENDHRPECVWTDWEHYVVTGGWGFCILWDISPDDSYVANDDDTADTIDYYTNNGTPNFLYEDSLWLPKSTNSVLTRVRFCKLRFDGKYLLAYTRPHGMGDDGAKPAVRVIDFVKLSSTKF